MSNHRQQLESTLTRAIQSVLAKGLSDPRVSGLITVTSVELIGDDTIANVYISVYPRDRERLTLHGLKHAAKHIRHQVSDLVLTRLMPELRFKIDLKQRQQDELTEALARVRAERPESAPDSPSPASDSHVPPVAPPGAPIQPPEGTS